MNKLERCKQLMRMGVEPEKLVYFGKTIIEKAEKELVQLNNQKGGKNKNGRKKWKKKLKITK